MRLSNPPPERTVGLWGATGVGVGAIVGGGVLVLAGAAYMATGPSAWLAFALNGFVAFLTAMSFAEISSALPTSGGAYNFARRILSLRAAFVAGWIIWFAYIVAAVLYALGFASYASLALQSLWEQPPAWLSSRGMQLLLAGLAVCTYVLALIRKASGGGQIATVGKVVLFAVLILGALVAFVGQPLEQTKAALSPHFPDGTTGLITAMGFTFIALQGFDLIPAIAGEVKDPARTIPRATFLSLGIAIVIYLPLLLLVAAVGAEPGSSIQAAAAAQPETVIAVAAERVAGWPGYWLVVIAALLATLSALNANLLAASRVALSMAQDRVLPSIFAQRDPVRGTPVVAVYTSGLAVIATVFMVADLASAGAAASLIFLITFALAHVTAYLARKRSAPQDGAYRTPLFPVVPWFGGVACAALGAFQAVVVPDAGAIVLIWLGLGSVLYLAVFARGARVFDASAEAQDPDLVRLRGRSPLVLVPIANPRSARPMAAVANALAPVGVGRVLLLSIVPAGRAEEDVATRLATVQEVMREALGASYSSGHKPEALITTASDAHSEIQRVAIEYDCQGLLLGVGTGSEIEMRGIQRIIDSVDADVGMLKFPDGWSLEAVEKVLVPIGRRGSQHELRARVLASIARTKTRKWTFLTVLPEAASPQQVAAAERDVRRLARFKVRGDLDAVVVKSDDPVAEIVKRAREHDFTVIGTGGEADSRRVLDLRLTDRGRPLGAFALRVASEIDAATIFLANRL